MDRATGAWAPPSPANAPGFRPGAAFPSKGRALPGTQEAAEVFTCTQPGGQPGHAVGSLEPLFLREPRHVHHVLGGEVQQALPELGEAQLGLGAEQHGGDACREPAGCGENQGPRSRLRTTLPSSAAPGLRG